MLTPGHNLVCLTSWGVWLILQDNSAKVFVFPETREGHSSKMGWNQQKSPAVQFFYNPKVVLKYTVYQFSPKNSYGTFAMFCAFKTYKTTPIFLERTHVIQESNYLLGNDRFS